VGFAYTPSRNGKTVIRGSYGVFYDVPALNFFVANTSSPNGGAAGVHANPGGASPVYTLNARNVVIQSGVPVFGSAGPVPPYGAFGVSQDFRTPYVQNFNLKRTAQLSSTTILQAGYVGSMGRKLAVMQDINQPIAGVRPFAQQFSQLAAIDVINSSLTRITIRCRSSCARLPEGVDRNVQLHLGSRDRQHVGCAQHGADQQLRPAQRTGSSTFDVRQIVTSFVSYQLPQWAPFAPRLTKGWQVNSLFTVHGGTPLNILPARIAAARREP